MCFPLYDILYKETDDSIKLSKDELCDLAHTINNLDYKEQEIIFVLIRIHHLKNSESIFDIPYKGVRKTGSKDIKFNLEKMPEKLISILYDFTNKHISSIKENIVSPN